MFITNDLQSISDIGVWFIVLTLFMIYYFAWHKRDRKFTKALRESIEELEEFAYVASHDIQEPVRMINQNIKRLEDHLNKQEMLDEKAQKYIKFIDDGSALIQVLITDLLEYSRLESELIEFQQVDLNEVLQVATKNLTLMIKENKAEIDSEKLPTIYGIQSLLIRLFTNLISNSIKYKKANLNPQIKISCNKVRNNYVINFEDNGIGFDPKFSKAIFKIFYRLHSQHSCSGTGIGLAACAKIVQYHHGKIIADSEPGEGSKFTVQFPIH